MSDPTFNRQPRQKHKCQLDVAHLDYKVLYDAMECCAFVAEALLPSSKGSKVGSGLGGLIAWHSSRISNRVTAAAAG